MRQSWQLSHRPKSHTSTRGIGSIRLTNRQKITLNHHEILLPTPPLDTTSCQPGHGFVFMNRAFLRTSIFLTTPSHGCSTRRLKTIQGTPPSSITEQRSVTCNSPPWRIASPSHYRSWAYRKAIA